MNKNLIKSKSSLYLTESIIKAKNYFFPYINQDNSNTIELDIKDNNNYKDNNFHIINNKKNTIFNNYNNFGSRKKKINLKLINDKYLLKTFDIKNRKEENS